MRGSSPSVERFACGSSLFASGAVTVSRYLAESSVRTRGHRESLRVLGGAALPQDANRRGACAGSPAPRPGGQRRLEPRVPPQHFGAASGYVLAPLPMAQALPQGGSSAKWLVGSCEGTRPGILYGSRGAGGGLATHAKTGVGLG